MLTALLCALSITAGCGVTATPNRDLDLELTVGAPRGTADPSATHPDGAAYRAGDLVDVGAADVIIRVDFRNRLLNGSGLEMPGDVDGDGHGDLVLLSEHDPGAVCDPGTCFGSNLRNALQVVYGGPALRATPDSALATSSTWFGQTYTSPSGGRIAYGNLDADGRVDLVFPLVDAYGRDAGATATLYGERWIGQRAAIGAGTVFRGADPRSLFGESGAIGDFDGDGHADLALGAPGRSGVTGAVYLFYGGSARREHIVPASAADAIIRTADRASRFGWVTTAGDLDGDGADELVIAHVGENDDRRQRGYLVRGSRSRIAGAVNVETLSSSAVNPAVFRVGDLDGDELDDLLFADGSVAYGVSGEDASFEMASGRFLANFDYESIVAAGDFNGDARRDLLFSGGHNDALDTAWLWLGEPGRVDADVDLDRGVTFVGRFLDGTARDGTGLAIAAGSDLDGDGLDDLAIGAEARVYVFLGRSEGTPPDAPPAVATTTSEPVDGTPIGPACGFNTCLPTEVCCSELCGLCAPAGRCAGDCLNEVVVCGGATCGAGISLCCPTCDADVCAPVDVDSRDACPPIHCG